MTTPKKTEWTKQRVTLLKSLLRTGEKSYAQIAKTLRCSISAVRQKKHALHLTYRFRAKGHSIRKGTRTTARRRMTTRTGKAA